MLYGRGNDKKVPKSSSNLIRWTLGEYLFILNPNPLISRLIHLRGTSDGSRRILEVLVIKQSSNLTEHSRIPEASIHFPSVLNFYLSKIRRSSDLQAAPDLTTASGIGIRWGIREKFFLPSTFLIPNFSFLENKI